MNEMIGTGDCIIYEVAGDEKRFAMPMLQLLKDREGVRVIGLVRYSQDVKPIMATGLFEAVYSTAEMMDALPAGDERLYLHVFTRDRTTLRYGVPL